MLFMTLVVVVIISTATSQTSHHNDEDIHGGVKMGIPDNGCDNAQWNLQMDWDNTTDIEYACQPGEETLNGDIRDTTFKCVDKKDIPRPLHECMDTEIVYTDIPPIGGPHRPLWPVFGEYQFAPPQRWVHSLEHGAVVFLYHPCAPPKDIQRLKKLAKSCLWRHIITPYRQLDARTPFGIVSYGCKLLMGKYDEQTARRFVQDHALGAPESSMTQNGTYDYGLVDKAKIISDIHDRHVCPRKQWPDEDMLIAEAMNDLNFGRP